LTHRGVCPAPSTSSNGEGQSCRRWSYWGLRRADENQPHSSCCIRNWDCLHNLL